LKVPAGVGVELEAKNSIPGCLNNEFVSGDSDVRTGSSDGIHIVLEHARMASFNEAGGTVVDMSVVP
jgi:hypothetical protein